MNAFERRLQHLSNILAILSGTLFALSKYFPQYFFPSAHPDPYAPVSSPSEPWFHDLHVLVVPILVFACGLIWRSHIVPKWNAYRNSSRPVPKKWSGLSLLFVALPMISTGYLVQVAVDDKVRYWFVVIHLATSAVWTLAYLAHTLFSKAR